jgi:ABC-type enterobactin transport system permease subunit
MKFAKQFGKDAVVSWKTTVGGIVAFIAILAPQMQTLLDNDAATNPDWNLIIAAASALMAAIFARDADKSTEDSK